MKTSTTIKSLVIILGLCLPGAACYRADSRAGNTDATRPRGATISEVKNRYREPYMQLRMRLAEIARGLPPMGSVTNPVGAADSRGRMANLNPLPTSLNTGFIAAEQLLDPGRLPPFDFFVLNLPHCPVQCFQWLSEAAPPVANPPEVEDRNGEMARGFEVGLARRYLVVHRATRYVRPQVSVPDASPGAGRGNLQYTPGAVDLEIIIVDLQSNAVVDSFRVQGATPTEISFPARSNSSTDSRERVMLSRLEDTLLNNVRASIFAGLTERTGRTFNLPSNAISN